MQQQHHDSIAEALRDVFCAVFCPCRHHRKRRATVTLDFGNGRVLSFNYTEGDTFMAVVIKTGGPLKFDISNFVDDKGNPVTDKDIPTLSSSDEAIATVAADPDDPDGQDALITLTGALTAEGETCVVKASFPAQKYGQPFEVVGNLIVVEPAAASAQAIITGPGVVEGA
jgi:hypothetical protein